MNPKKVSIIVPAYNSEKHIRECLESIIEQEYENIEIIIINDGSTDETLNIIREFKNENIDKEITIIDSINRGVSAARNLGIEQATGDYICFVDSDDSITTNHISSMYTFAVNNSVECVITSLNGNQRLRKVKKIGSNSALWKFLRRKIRPGVWSLLIEKKIIDKNKIEFIEGLKYSEDIIFVYKVLEKSNNILLSPEGTYIYRVHDDSVMSKFNDDRLRALEEMEKLSEYFKEINSEFYKKYARYGVARWKFATLWQIAFSSSNYDEFKEEILKYKMRTDIYKLIFGFGLKVGLLSLIFTISPNMYYKIIIKNKNKITTRNITK